MHALTDFKYCSLCMVIEHSNQKHNEEFCSSKRVWHNSEG
jgi:hypothetical protein